MILTLMKGCCHRLKNGLAYSEKSTLVCQWDINFTTLSPECDEFFLKPTQTTSIDVLNHIQCY
jgi:hypothetical protein